MQIVINIAEEIKQKRDAGKVLSSEEIATVCMAIKNGTPLPKGHGRLIDADVVKEGIGNLDGFGVLGRCIDEMPKVIEADGGDAE